MTNAELITALRVKPFEVESVGLAKIMNAAADLIEAQQADLRKANEIIAEGIKASRKSRAALETAEKLIAKLEAQLPKEGEWIEDKYSQGHNLYTCSVCGLAMITTPDYAEKHHYCYGCGAKNKVKRMKGEQE